MSAVRSHRTTTIHYPEKMDVPRNHWGALPWRVAPMNQLPDTEHALVIRTDFSDDAAWNLICREIQAPVGPFRAYVSFLSDRTFEEVTAEQLTAVARSGPYRTFLFVVDTETLKKPEHPILVLDLVDEPGRTFRVVPAEMWSVENNLSICNMDFAEFAESADEDHVYRGFGPN